MKWLVVFLFLPCCCLAQGVRLNQYDVFLKKHRVEIEPVTLLSSPAAALSVGFSSLASDLFIQLKGSGWGAITIDEGDDLIFHFTNDSSVTVKSVSLQTFEPGIEQSTYKHQYRLTPASLQALQRFELAAIRKYSFKEFSEIRIPKEASAKLQKPVALFLSELKKAETIKTLKRIDVRDIYSHVGDSVFFCSKVYRVREAAGEGGAAVLKVQSDYSQPVVQVLVRPQDRANFGELSEAALLNKEVCVSGVVVLRENVPSLWVQKKEQLKIAAAETNVTNGQQATEASKKGGRQSP